MKTRPTMEAWVSSIIEAERGHEHQTRCVRIIIGIVVGWRAIVRHVLGIGIGNDIRIDVTRSWLPVGLNLALCRRIDHWRRSGYVRCRGGRRRDLAGHGRSLGAQFGAMSNQGG